MIVRTISCFIGQCADFLCISHYCKPGSLYVVWASYCICIMGLIGLELRCLGKRLDRVWMLFVNAMIIVPSVRHHLYTEPMTIVKLPVIILAADGTSDASHESRFHRCRTGSQNVPPVIQMDLCGHSETVESRLPRGRGYKSQLYPATLQDLSPLFTFKTFVSPAANVPQGV
jgi:hypothetical protein